MKKTTYAILAFVMFSFYSIHAQVGIGNTSPKSILDISASSAANPTNKDGLLVPRVSAFPAEDPSADQNGMMIFLTTPVATNDVGFYYWNDSQSEWIGIGAEEWKSGSNESGDNLIYATRAKLTGTDMVITDDGRIGFGTSDPVERFEFRGPGDNDFQITSANTNPPNYILYNTGGTLDTPGPLASNGEIGSFIVKTHDGDGIVETGGFRFFMDGVATSGSAPSRFVINTTPEGSTSQQERIVVRSTGNVGIGTSDPSERLDVNGGVRIRTLTAGPVYSDAQGNLSNMEAAPMIVAAGKITVNKAALKVTGATVNNSRAGKYQITFDHPLSSSNYIIQLSTLYNGNESETYSINYSNQTNAGFSVDITSINTTNNSKTAANQEFMFTVIDF